MSRTGRPKSDNPKETQLGVRLNREELKMVDFVSKYYSETRTSSFRRGIKKLYEEIRAYTKDKE